MNKKFNTAPKPTITAENHTAENNSAADSAAIGAAKYISDRVRANNAALKRFYKDCKLVDGLPIDEELKGRIVSQLVAAIRDCFRSLEQSI